MIKQIWRVRSKPKLYNGLSLVITIIILVYTVLNILYMPSEIPFSVLNYQNVTLMFSKFVLIIVPVISTAIYFYLYLSTTKLKKRIISEKATNRLKSKKTIVLHDTIIGVNFLTALTLFFIQLNFLNNAKEIRGFSVLPIIACFIALVIYLFNMISRYKKMK